MMRTTTKALFFCLFICCNFSSSLAQSAAMQINSSFNITFVVLDSIGRRTGVDCRRATSDTSWLFYHEIPDANYAVESLGSLDSLQTPTYGYEFWLPFELNRLHGSFTIQVSANKIAAFDLYVAVGTYQAGEGIYSEFSQVPIDKDSMICYKLYVPRSNLQFSTIVRIVTPATLHQDFVAMQRLGWISSGQAVDRYVDLIRSYPLYASTNRIEMANQTLALIELQTDSNAEAFLSPPARRVLLDDIRALKLSK